MIYPMTQAMYTDGQASKCPACGSDAVDTYSARAKQGSVQQEWRCADCEASWVAVYGLVGYRNLAIPIPADQEEAMLVKMIDQMLRLTLSAHAFLSCRDGMADALLHVPSVRKRLQELWTQECFEQAKAQRKTDVMGRVEGRVLVDKETNNV